MLGFVTDTPAVGRYVAVRRTGVGRACAPPVDCPGVVNADAAIDAEDAIPISALSRRHPLYRDRADARARRKLAPHVEHGVALTLREDFQTAQRETAEATGDPAAADDRYRLAEGVDADAACEEQIDGLWCAGRENARVLEEERSLFRIEQGKAGEIRAHLVDLHLREVGVVGEVERHTLGQAVLDLAADLLALSGLRIDGVDAFYTRERVGRNGRHVARRYLAALQRAGPRALHQGEFAWHGAPRRCLIHPSAPAQ